MLRRLPCEATGETRELRRTDKLDESRQQAKRAMEIYEESELTKEHIRAIQSYGISDPGKAREIQDGTGRNAEEVMELAEEAKEETAEFVRGKIDIEKTAREPWKPEVHQTRRDLTADIEHNRILLWTLWKVLSSDLLRNQTRTKVRRAVRSLQDIASLQEYAASEGAQHHRDW